MRQRSKRASRRALARGSDNILNLSIVGASVTARALRVAIAASVMWACSAEPAGTAQAHTARKTSAGAIDLPSVAYTPVALAAFGSIGGTVEIDGAVPADSVVLPDSDRELCGSAVPDSSVVRRGNTLANAVVWLADVKEGKALPAERRTEMVNEECRLAPRVQAVIAGTTVNVRNEDRLAHTTRFLRGGAGGDTLAIVPLTDDGQVVPNEHIAAKGGMVAVTCAQHGWTRGYIAVFESPYFSVTDESGAFRLDSVPPGRYRLLVWHERASAPDEHEVEVSASGMSRVEVKLRLK